MGEHVSQWLTEARANADPDLVITLVGNKCDRASDRQVTFEEGHAFAQHHSLYFLETSAVTGHMVDQAFHVTARLVDKRNEQNAVYDKQSSGGGNDYLNPGVNSSKTPGSLRLSQHHAHAQPHSQQEESCCM